MNPELPTTERLECVLRTIEFLEDEFADDDDVQELVLIYTRDLLYLLQDQLASNQRAQAAELAADRRAQAAELAADQRAEAGGKR